MRVRETFNTLLEMLSKVNIEPFRICTSFQYSIRDAGGQRPERQRE